MAMTATKDMLGQTSQHHCCRNFPFTVLPIVQLHLKTIVAMSSPRRTLKPHNNPFSTSSELLITGESTAVKGFGSQAERRTVETRAGS